MAKLTLNLDGYGSRGQLSLLADFFEFCCSVRKLEINHAVIADYLRDRGIRISLHAQVPLHGELTTEGSVELADDATPTDHASAEDGRRRRGNEDSTRVMGLLRERQHYLAKLYPFDIDANDRLTRRLKTTTAYDVALALALRHGCVGDRTVANEFEGFVERCLIANSYRVFPLGARIRAARSSGATRFREVFSDLADHLNVRPALDVAVPSHIHDGGADVLARWGPRDDRPGCRTLLVQATVGKADTWRQKALEPPTSRWKSLLGDPVPPLVTLAVPHHVEREYLREIVDESHGATVFDRLRLVAHQPKITRAERSGVAAFRSSGVEW